MEPCVKYSALCGSHTPASSLPKIQVPDILYLSLFHLSILFWKLGRRKSNQFLKSISYLLLHNKQHFWCGQKEQEQNKPFIFFHKSHIIIFFHVPFLFPLCSPWSISTVSCAFLHKQISDLKMSLLTMNYPRCTESSVVINSSFCKPSRLWITDKKESRRRKRLHSK